jgi:hypothetical protein
MLFAEFSNLHVCITLSIVCAHVASFCFGSVFCKSINKCERSRRSNFTSKGYFISTEVYFYSLRELYNFVLKIIVEFSTAGPLCVFFHGRLRFCFAQCFAVCTALGKSRNCVAGKARADRDSFRTDLVTHIFVYSGL